MLRWILGVGVISQPTAGLSLPSALHGWRSSVLTRGSARCSEGESFSFSEVSLEALRSEQRTFVDERDWAQFHTPRSLALAMVGEVGELCELLQWRGDDGARPGLAGWTSDERMRFSEELADVLSYVVRLADVAEM